MPYAQGLGHAVRHRRATRELGFEIQWLPHEGICHRKAHLVVRAHGRAVIGSPRLLLIVEKKEMSQWQ